MKVTVIGAGNSGLAMAAHLSKEGNRVTLWNRSQSTISKLKETRTIYCEGAINGKVKIDMVTSDFEKAVQDQDIILITTPANVHKEIAGQLARTLKKETLIVLNPGRTFGALEFEHEYNKWNKELKQTIAETQTIIYTCRKTAEDAVNIISLKSDVLLSVLNSDENENVIARLPECIREHFIPAKSMIETSIGNVGMILHCAPLLLNTGWTESKTSIYKYYFDGITPTIGRLIEKIDAERVMVSKKLGLEVESTKEWLQRTYHVEGKNLYECVQSNKFYETIDAPSSMEHRYIYEDIPCGLVPLEIAGKKLGLKMPTTGLIIDLASALMETDFRMLGRNLDFLCEKSSKHDFKALFGRGAK